jgi:hypothetical protein
MLREALSKTLISVTSEKTDPVMDDPSADNKATYRSAVARWPKVLSTGESRYNRYHRAPVFFLYLTGAAKENFVVAPSPQHATAARHPSPANPLVNPATPWLWSRPTAKRAGDALKGRRDHAR